MQDPISKITQAKRADWGSVSSTCLVSSNTRTAKKLKKKKKKKGISMPLVKS
jgi:hypothetical protein